MNKFIKYPLILGLVGTICAGALSVVYEITKDKIAYNNNKEAFDLLGGIVPDMDSVESVVKNYDEAKLAKAGISNIYEIKEDNKISSYGYMAGVNAYGKDPIVFILVLSATENVIVGFDVVSHSETNSGKYGGPLLNSPEFDKQFENIKFDEVGEKVDFVAGSTAKITLDAVKSGVDGVIAFHRFELLGEVDDGISLSTTERKMLGLPEDYVMSDKTEDFKTTLKGKVSANMYNKTIEGLGLLNYIEFTNAANEVKGHAYVVEGKYNCEVEHGNRAWQTYKFVFFFDETGANTKLTIVQSGDSLGAIGLPSIGDQPWIAEEFNNTTLANLNSRLSNSEIDKISGATFTSIAIKEHMAAVISAHSRAYGI